MDALPMHEIPFEILDLENGVVKIFDHYKGLIQKARSNEADYILAFTTLINMEEAADSKRVQILNLKNVQMLLQSQPDKIFKVEYSVRIFKLV